jgi:hypothetical protein
MDWSSGRLYDSPIWKITYLDVLASCKDVPEYQHIVYRSSGDYKELPFEGNIHRNSRRP